MLRVGLGLGAGALFALRPSLAKAQESKDKQEYWTGFTFPTRRDDLDMAGKKNNFSS
jgi:hypothetical protein